jgi:DNA mismatch repair protein MSH5
VNTFVPNDARIVGGVGHEGTGSTFGLDDDDDVDDWNSVVLCTGANACGKVVV